MVRNLLSVIVTTYNRPAHLRRALEGLRLQSGVNFEIIVADDGSGPETREMVESFALQAPFRVAHVWQENKGFRAARIRNLGILASQGERVLFLDGDCVPLPGFLATHGDALGTDRVLAGTRLFLDREPSESLTPDEIRAGRLGDLIPDEQFRSVRWTATKNFLYRYLLAKERPKVVTANLSVSRRALDAVNGLDERFVGWGKEDDDLRRRLVRHGFPLRSVFTTAHACHLWHEPVESFPGRVRDTNNIGYYNRGYYLTRCRMGLRKRPIEGCTVAFNGERANGFLYGTATRGPEVAIGWGPQPRYTDAQVRVFVATAVAEQPRGSVDLVLRPGDPTANSAEDPRTLILPQPLDPSKEPDRQRILAALDPVL